MMVEYREDKLCLHKYIQSRFMTELLCNALKIECVDPHPFHPKKCIVLEAREDGVKAGELILVLGVTGDGRKTAQIHLVTVAKERRGRGVGKALVASALHLADEYGAETVIANVLPDELNQYGLDINEKAMRHILESFGFTEDREFDGHYTLHLKQRTLDSILRKR